MTACIIEGLGDIHAARIVHRDIKPANMIWDPEGYVLITDFGLASETNANGSHIKSSGTIRFMAPEVLFKQGHTYQSDFYAIGILLYYFLMKKYPYVNQDRKLLREEMEGGEQIKINYEDIDQEEFPDSSIVDFTNKLLNRD
jgi:serine/threonine protein kinase